MTEEEARILIQAQGWRYKERSPRGHAKYVYAKRWEKGKLLERYICPLSRLGELTEQELRAKLVPKPESSSLDISL